MSPCRAAHSFHKFLLKYAQERGYNTKYIYLWSPKESDSRGYGKGWSVCFEEGPYEWAVHVSLGMGMHGETLKPTDLDVTKAYAGVLCEPWNSHILCFHNN